MSQYGMKMNFATVKHDDDTYDMGLILNDSNGLNINKSVKGSTNLVGSVSDVIKAVTKEINEHAAKLKEEKNTEACACDECDCEDAVDIEEYEEAIDELIAQNDALVDENDKLAARIDELEQRLRDMSCEKQPKEEPTKENVFGLTESEKKLLSEMLKYLS